MIGKIKMVFKDGRIVTKTVPFNKNDIKSYLDRCIDKWREVRDSETDSRQLLAVHYIDAFQSVRISIFGELKE